MLRHLADEFADAEIAARVCVSTKTIDTDVRNVLSKLGVPKLGQAAALAYRNLAS